MCSLCCCRCCRVGAHDFLADCCALVLHTAGCTHHARHRTAACSLAENPARAKYFHQQSEQHLAAVPDPYTVFLRCASAAMQPDCWGRGCPGT